MITRIFFLGLNFLHFASCASVYTVPELAPIPGAQACTLIISGKPYQEYRLDRAPHNVLPDLKTDNQGNMGTCSAHSLADALKASLAKNGHPDISYLGLILMVPAQSPRITESVGSNTTLPYYDSGHTCDLFNEVKSQGVCLKSTSVIEMAEQEKLLNPMGKAKLLNPWTDYFKSFLELNEAERIKWLENLNRYSETARKNKSTGATSILTDPPTCGPEGVLMGLESLLTLGYSLLEDNQKSSIASYFTKTESDPSSTLPKKLSPDFKNQLLVWYPKWIKNNQQFQQDLVGALFLELKNKNKFDLGLEAHKKIILNILGKSYLQMDAYFESETCIQSAKLKDKDQQAFSLELKKVLDACVTAPNSLEKQLSKALGVEGISLLGDNLLNPLLNQSTDRFQLLFNQIFLPSCKGRRVLLPNTLQCIEHESLTRLKENIVSNAVVMASIKTSLFSSKTTLEINRSGELSRALHSMAIIGLRGRKNATGECEPEYLIHNSWGGGCTGNLGQLSKERCDPKSGEFWIPESLLNVAKYSEGRQDAKRWAFQVLQQ